MGQHLFGLMSASLISSC